MVAYREIKTDEGDIKLWDLLSDDGTPNYESALEFTNANHQMLWDNSEYVLDFFKGLSKNKTSKKDELKHHCNLNKLDYKITKKDLKEIYKLSKKLGFWKQ